jgi:uncharacterized protein (DUF2141 family)
MKVRIHGRSNVIALSTARKILRNLKSRRFRAEGVSHSREARLCRFVFVKSRFGIAKAVLSAATTSSPYNRFFQWRYFVPSIAWRLCLIALLLSCSSFVPAQSPATAASNGCTLTLIVEGMSSDEGNLGVLVFNGPRGWAEDRTAALRDIAVPAVKGIQTLKVPNLPPGKYAVALIHDLNKNHKLDKNFIGVPKEQWGMSNNPHATIKAPPIAKAMVGVDKDTEIHIQLQ